MNAGAQVRSPAVSTVRMHLRFEGLGGGDDAERDGALEGWTGEEIREFYAQLRTGATPHTAAPSPGDWLAAITAAPAGEVICLTMAARWSAAHQAARLAASLVPEGGPHVTVVDTDTAAAGYGVVCRLAADLAAAGADAAAVLARADRAIRTVRMYGTLPSLAHVAASGRVPALIAGLSDRLHLHPVFSLEAGRTRRAGIARSRRGAIRQLGALGAAAVSGPARVLVFHGDAEEDAAVLAAAVRERLDVRTLETVLLDPVIGAHAGPGALGFGVAPLEEADPCCS